jgi:endonuclease-3 related protein
MAFPMEMTGMAARSKTKDIRFIELYRIMREAYGPQRWWPVTPEGGMMPEYSGGPRNEAQRFEVAVGAVLTQNTAWKNASRAIESLTAAGLLSPRALAAASEKRLAAFVRPAGYYNQKAARLKGLAEFFRSGTDITRDSLLALKGIGPETADSIMLYAFGRPYFIVDAYTRRIFGRAGLIDPGARYEEIRRRFEEGVPRSVRLYQEYHALIVEHGKRSCRVKPRCGECVVLRRCDWGRGRT